MIAIPKRFKLAGREWVVEIVETIPGENDKTYGMTEPHEARISIKGNMTPAETQHTFYHELEHAMRSTLGLSDEDEDHGEVDARGNLMYQFLSTRRGRADA